MANKDCPDCNDWGGNWPSRPPYNGGPWPTRTPGTGRNQGVCNRFALSFTQEEKDMRRKAEVLQHRQNQTNLTKNQQWAYAVRHLSTNPARGAQLAKEAKNCPKIIYSSSHASAVPGPDTTLYLDPDVPVFPLQSGLQQSTVGGGNEPVRQIQCTPGIIPTVLIPKLVQLYCGSNDETLINMPPIYDDPTPPLDPLGDEVAIRNWFRHAQQIPDYGPQKGQFVICTSSDTKGLINAGESAFENMPAQLEKRMPNEDISKHFFSADSIVAGIKARGYTTYTTVKNYLSMDDWFKTVPHIGAGAAPFGNPESAISVLWWSFYTHWDSPVGNPIQGFTPGIDKTGFKLCWISNKALEALTCTAFTPILPVYQNPSRIELCPPSSSSNCITEPPGMGSLQPKDLASLKIDRTPIYLSA